MADFLLWRRAFGVLVIIVYTELGVNTIFSMSVIEAAHIMDLAGCNVPSMDVLSVAPNEVET